LAKNRVFTREFKESVAQRMLKGESVRAIGALTKELMQEWQGCAPARQLAIKSLLMSMLMKAYRAPAGDFRPPDATRRR